ncbi:transposase [Streptosporangium sp. NPDC050855]|uniref:transposase n=1 Tax=Streptosporangium sp. NPDC050855 TaxID=3366194 RepID=UPI0037B4AFA1
MIEPYLSVAVIGPLPRRVRDRFDGILWRFRTGSGRRDVPERCGSWSTFYSRFSGWAKAGVFQGLVDALLVEAALRGQVGLEVVSVTPRSCGRVRSRPGRPASDPPCRGGRGGRGRGLLLQGQPLLPAPPQDHRGHPGEE